jgi:hypothetical protein
VLLVGDAVDLLAGEGEAEDEHGMEVAQYRYRAVVKTRTIADPVAAAVERDGGLIRPLTR